MTNNQLIQEYEFDPTLTTSELKALEAERDAKAHEVEEASKGDDQLANLQRKCSNALKEFLANPTLENAKIASGLLDFHSDCYKDENGVRPHWMWEREFEAFTPEHKRVWEENFQRLMPR